MFKFFKWVRQLFSYRSEILMHDIPGGFTEYSDISTTAFTHEKLLQDMKNDVIVLIVNNDFIANPAVILSFFKRNYDFTINEFAVLSFKLGLMTKLYIDNPVLLLEDAIKLNDIFTKESILRLEDLLKKQIIYDDSISEKEHKEFEIKLKEKEQEAKLKANDPDALIDDWLRKNKKN